MSEAEAPETLETLSGPLWKREGGLHAMIGKMKDFKYHRWGFVIFRGTYNDDPAWERYMMVLRHRVQRSLQRAGEARLLPQYLQFTIIEDPTLEGASKPEIRTRFRQWVAEGSEERDGLGSDYVKMQGVSIPRFSYCLYVNQRCLNTVPAWEAWRDAGHDTGELYTIPCEPLVACILVDMNCTTAGKGQLGYPNVEGCVRYYTGWMFLCVHTIPSAYNSLSIDGLNWRSDLDYWYCRPPLISPAQDRGETVPP